MGTTDTSAGRSFGILSVAPNISDVLTVLILTDGRKESRVHAFHEELRAKGARVEYVPPFAGVDVARWAVALEQEYDAVVVVPISRDMESTPLGLAYSDAAKARRRTGRPKLFLSLPQNAVVPWLYSQGTPTLLPENAVEAVALILDALK